MGYGAYINSWGKHARAMSNKIPLIIAFGVSLKWAPA
jgi:hypothetical protein